MNLDLDKIPKLYVDLDGTFIKSDILYESLVAAVKNNPWVIFLCVFWLMKGKSHLKHKLSQRADIACGLLPLNMEFYSFLVAEKEKNRTIVLATASNFKYAKEICNQYPLFDSFISSDQYTNLKGEAKLKKISSLSDTFAYAGNSSEDFVIFEKADERYLVNPTRKARRMSSKADITTVFDGKKKGMGIWVKQLRIHQWLKNILIFVPLLVSGKFMELEFLSLSLLGFLSFSLLASATYIVNDLADLENDRHHVRKNSRPLAAGKISIFDAIILAGVLLGISFGIASMIDGMFVFVLMAYLFTTLLYTLKIKQYIGLDVITLASLYTIRIFAGAAALSIMVSFWLFSFSMFCFFSLALVKRCAELKSHDGQDKTRVEGRDYRSMDYNILVNLGTSSALLAVLMFCFYTNSNALSNQYQDPTLLWLIVPALCYWLIRMWIKTNRGEMHDDPIIFSLTDKGSLMTIVFIVLITLIAQLL